ncbi:trypsin-like peptidase domain-containing protein [Flavimaricola marinus]|uniref:Putative serine protease HhoB n=1 Tax=Flavimaricola marinus TaxID=1819565 RepID=A0A238LAN8_9RHOB|nr:trypsin-like peptidase domain-containing protein [Flavimaricola marinus]SMY06698.1 Putative serine protease HhoB precursor [Flavimaricola marinus]
MQRCVTRLGFALWMLFACAAASAQPITSSGSGFQINSAGWILTNRHVVEDCDILKANGTPVSNRILDESSDLAAVFAGQSTARPTIPIRLQPARLAEDLFVIGFPLSDLLSESVKVTTGSVSSLAGIGNDERYLQISAPIQPGNSGGPVLDARGNALGVASATLSEAAFDRAQNVNFALKAQEIARFLTESGIAYNIAAGNSAPIPAPDMIEAAMQSVVYLTCHQAGSGTTQPSAPNPPARQSTGSGFVTIAGYDSVAFDLRAIRDVTFQTCNLECQRDPNCNVITFNTRHSVCFLKSTSMILVRNADAVSAMPPWLQNDVVQTNISVTANVDSPGGDYLRLRGSDFMQCFLECAGDNRCLAFAYVRQTNDCWLKDRVGQIQPMPGVEFGRF